MEKRKILVVDDNVTNLNVVRNALEKDYEVFLMPSGEKALKVLTKIQPDLILLDVEMPEMNGFEVITKIKELGEPYNDIPVVFLTAKDDTNSEFEGLDLGAVDYIIKPFSFPLLLKRVELHLKLADQTKELQDYSDNLSSMIAAQTQTIKELQYAIIYALANMVERRDGSTGRHIMRTSKYLEILLLQAHKNGVYKDQLDKISVKDYVHAAKLHDIGKISTIDDILLKKDKLTDDEYELMKSHTIVGEEAIRETMQLVGDSTFLSIAAEFIGAHHEKWDGSGYPRALKGEDIPLNGRFMAIADVYDALTTQRPYKPAFSHEDSLKIMYDGDGSHFDPTLMKLFREVESEFAQIAEEFKDH